MQPSATPYLELAATLMFHSNPWNRYVYTYVSMYKKAKKSSSEQHFRCKCEGHFQN